MEVTGLLHVIIKMPENDRFSELLEYGKNFES